ncbi:MAG TPA: carboxypeptidase-like regulatory domain-containing protein, partial [Gemmatimonadaceae bacterium]
MHDALVRRLAAGFRLLAFTAVAFVRVPSIAAQATTGSVEGRVATADSASPAHVDVRDQSTGTVRRVTSDRHGHYRVLALGPGLYDVTASALG